jgi:hypothetical protein
MKGTKNLMTRKERRELARKIAKLEKQSNENNISEKMSEMELLVSKCSIDELLQIDEIITKKYLTS